MPVCLQASGVTKRFGKNSVLNNISFRVQSGEFIGITGENGAGKSTLLKILCGLLKPDSGRIELSGTFGYCPQEPFLFHQLTVEENFNYFASAYNMPHRDLLPARDELLQVFNFARYRNKPVCQLSGGTQQKLNLSLALLHSPGILILDEPYASFDWDTYSCFWDYTGKLKERGKSILLVSHLLHDTTVLDKYYVLNAGEMRCI